MSGYVITPDAASDLLRIWLYIARDSEEIADRVQAEFYEVRVLGQAAGPRASLSRLHEGARSLCSPVLLLDRLSPGI